MPVLITPTVLLLAACGFTQAPPTARNVVVILADDMGFASLHAEHPGSGLPTPNLDRLHAQSMSFTDAHSGSAVCSPTRYGLLTGRYAWRTRMKQGIVAKWGPPLIAEDRITLADVGHEATLHTACIGKWHLGWHWPTADGGTTTKAGEVDFSKPIGGGPLEAGFDHYFGDDVPNWPPYTWFEDDRILIEPTETMPAGVSDGVRGGPSAPDWSLKAVMPELTRRCVGYIRDRARADEPFLLYYSMVAPHTPIEPSDSFNGISGVSKYADFLLETDWSVGQLLRALDQYGVADDTLVIFTADNGTSPKCLFDTLEAGGVDLRAHWRGMKADVFEGGHRVPFLVRWPGVVQPGTTCDEPIVLTDIMATVAGALGVELSDSAAEDSVSLMPRLQQQVTAAPLHDAIVNHSSQGRFAVRDGNWKLCCCASSGGWTQPTSEKKALAAGLPAMQLYDLSVDPGESNNLAESNSQQVERMLGLLRAVIERESNDGGDWWGKLPWADAHKSGI